MEEGSSAEVDIPLAAKVLHTCYHIPFDCLLTDHSYSSDESIAARMERQ
jgi:hypothetical protein